MTTFFISAIILAIILFSVEGIAGEFGKKHDAEGVKIAKMTIIIIGCIVAMIRLDLFILYGVFASMILKIALTAANKYLKKKA